MMRMQREHFTVKYKDSDYLNCFGVIYLITNIVNNKIYVGQSVNFYKRVQIHERTSFNKKIEIIIILYIRLLENTEL